MLQTMIIWTAAAPAAIAAIVMALAWRLGSDDAEDRTSAVAGALAPGLAYVAGHIGLQGGPGIGIEGGLLTICLGAGAIALLLALAPLSPRMAPLVRLLASAGAAWVVLSPLAAPQQWSTGRYAAHLALVTVAMMAVWLGFDRLLRRARGPAAPLGLAVLVAGSSGVVVMGALAFTARLLGPLAAGLGVVFLASWLLPARPLLRAAAPLLSLVVVSHWAAAMFYGELPPASMILLVLAPLPLLLLGTDALQRAGRVATLAAALTLAALPLVGAAVPAAMSYFGDTPAAEAGAAGAEDPDDDYGYD